MKNAGLAVLALVAITAFVAACYGGYWWLSKDTTNRSYGVTTHSQQYQAGLIQQARDDARGWSAAMDPNQKALLKSEFCGAYADLTQVPTDVMDLAAQLNCH